MTKLIVDFYERVLIDVLKGYAMMIVGYELFRGREYNYSMYFAIHSLQLENFYF